MSGNQACNCGGQPRAVGDAYIGMGYRPTPVMDRIHGRILVRLYEQYSREIHKTSWIGSPEDYKYDFTTWLWEYLAGDLDDVVVDAIPELEEIVMKMCEETAEKVGKMLRSGASARTRRSRRQ